MLIITADDYGMTRQATDNILECFRSGRITSASGMVFMEDSERAATLARGTSMEVGLHLNLTQAFSGPGVDEQIRRLHAQVARYLNGHRFAQALFNPWLASAFRILVAVQWKEFERLYGQAPDFVNGHHHMHLAANVQGQGLLPAGSRIRGPFTFRPGEKSRLNRWYRNRLAARLRKTFITPDALFSIEPLANLDRLRGIIHQSLTVDVELEVHPETPAERQFLLAPEFGQLLDGVDLQGFRQLGRKSSRDRASFATP